MRQSIGSDNREQLLKDVESLSLEKYIEEIASVAVEGVGRCKTEKDIWSAVEVSHSCFAYIIMTLIRTILGYFCFPSSIPQILHACGCRIVRCHPSGSVTLGSCVART
jgi:regulator of nonsense transcripts 2